MQYTLINNTAISYRNVWHVLKEELEVDDIPLECVPELRFYNLLAAAVEKAEEGISSPLYEAMLSGFPPLPDNSAGYVTVKVSEKSSYPLVLDKETTIQLPYLMYVVKIYK